MRILWTAAVVSLCVVVAPAITEQWLYFNAGNLMRMRTDGTDLQVIEPEIPHCFFRSVAVDGRIGQAYYVETCTLPSAAIIYRWDSTSGRQWILSAGAFNTVNTIAIDSMAEAVYFDLAVDDGEIDRKYLRTGTLETVVRNVGRTIWAIAIDEASEKLYWTTSDSLPPVGRIRRADLDGSNVEDFVVDLAAPRELAIDPIAGKIYWAEQDSSRIQRADLADGGNVESIVGEGSGRIFGITLDISARKIYWANYDLATIRRANLDGSNVEDVRTGIAVGAIEIGPDRVVPVRSGSWSDMKGNFRHR
jgi:hypothetical protein